MKCCRHGPKRGFREHLARAAVRSDQRVAPVARSVVAEASRTVRGRDRRRRVKVTARPNNRWPAHRVQTVPEPVILPAASRHTRKAVGSDRPGRAVPRTPRDSATTAVRAVAQPADSGWLTVEETKETERRENGTRSLCASRPWFPKATRPVRINSSSTSDDCSRPALVGVDERVACYVEACSCRESCCPFPCASYWEPR